MTCDDRRDAIFLYAAGELEPGEADAVRAHLATGCPRCAGTLAEAEAVLASMSLALPPVMPDPVLKQELMARVTGSGAAASTAIRGIARPTTSRLSQASAPLTGASPPVRGRFTLGSLVAYSGLAAAIAAVVTGVVVWQNVRGKMDTLTAEVGFLHAERLQLVSLAVPEGKGPATGHVFWDLDRGQWRVIVFNLKPLSAGKAYQLWAIPDGGGPIPMDTFNVDANGRATITQSVPTSTTALKLAAITAEPVGGSKAPTGAIELVGQAK
jgi:hypothetical protein